MKTASQWQVRGKAAEQRDLIEALALSRQHVKAVADREREERQRDADARKVGRALKQARTDGSRGRYNLRCTPARVSGTRHGGIRLRRFETLAGLTHPKRSYVAKDGFSNFHCKFRPRGLGTKRGYRKREVVRTIRYILRDSAREIAGWGVVSSISTDADEIASVFAALEELELVAGRANAHVYSSVIVSLPHELGGRREALLDDICQPLAELALPFAAVLHAPDPEGDQRNFHAHIVFSFRPFEALADGRYAFADHTRAELNTDAFIYAFRTRAAEAMNRAMAQAGFARRFTPESKTRRGLSPGTSDQAKHSPGHKHDRRRDDNIKLGQAEQGWLDRARAAYARLASTARTFAATSPDYRKERIAVARTREAAIVKQVRKAAVVLDWRWARVVSGEGRAPNEPAIALRSAPSLSAVPALSMVPNLSRADTAPLDNRGIVRASQWLDEKQQRPEPKHIGPARSGVAAATLEASKPPERDEAVLPPAASSRNAGACGSDASSAPDGRPSRSVPGPDDLEKGFAAGSVAGDVSHEKRAATRARSDPVSGTDVAKRSVEQSAQPTTPGDRRSAPEIAKGNAGPTKPPDAALDAARAAARARGGPSPTTRTGDVDTRAIRAALEALPNLPLRRVAAAEGRSRAPRFELVPHHADRRDRDIIDRAARLKADAALQALFAAKWEATLAALRAHFIARAGKRKRTRIFDTRMPKAPRLRAALDAAGRDDRDIVALQNDFDAAVERAQALDTVVERIAFIPAVEVMSSRERNDLLDWSRQLIGAVVAGSAWLSERDGDITGGWTTEDAQALLHPDIAGPREQILAMVAQELSSRTRPAGEWTSSTVISGAADLDLLTRLAERKGSPSR